MGHKLLPQPEMYDSWQEYARALTEALGRDEVESIDAERIFKEDYRANVLTPAGAWTGTMFWYKDHTGLVRLGGNLQKTGPVGAGDLMTTLPVNARPTRYEAYPMLSFAGGVYQTDFVQVATGGGVTYLSAAAPAGVTVVYPSVVEFSPDL